MSLTCHSMNTANENCVNIIPMQGWVCRSDLVTHHKSCDPPTVKLSYFSIFKVIHLHLTTLTRRIDKKLNNFLHHIPANSSSLGSLAGPSFPFCSYISCHFPFAFLVIVFSMSIDFCTAFGGEPVVFRASSPMWKLVLQLTSKYAISMLTGVTAVTD